MNLERTSKVTIAVTFKELVSALEKQFPNEFLLTWFDRIPVKDISVEILSAGIALTGLKKSQGPAEIDFNRQQRVDTE